LDARAIDKKEIDMKKAKQIGMFPQGEGFPLFSGTAQRAKLETFKPQEIIGKQLHMGECPLCEDTGIMHLYLGSGKRFCYCKVGNQAKGDRHGPRTDRTPSDAL
jgi:hypothetical protein